MGSFQLQRSKSYQLSCPSPEVRGLCNSPEASKWQLGHLRAKRNKKADLREAEPTMVGRGSLKTRTPSPGRYGVK